ncbi:MAG: addiction module antidote protein, HigA family [Desulfobacteraceae bacterium IS3]|nr:MAG: addiction module antidote protein, HigA family [Desulfobacteraceae bacterium IS3]
MTKRRKPVHPGEVLREDVINPLGLTITEAARRLKVNRKTLSALLNCKTSLSPEMAVRIAKATGTTPESWLYMQAKLDIWGAEQAVDEVEELCC